MQSPQAYEMFFERVANRMNPNFTENERFDKIEGWKRALEDCYTVDQLREVRNDAVVWSNVKLTPGAKINIQKCLDETDPMIFGTASRVSTFTCGTSHKKKATGTEIYSGSGITADKGSTVQITSYASSGTLNL